MFHEPHWEDWICRESELLLQCEYSTFSPDNMPGSTLLLELMLLHCEKSYYAFEAGNVCKGNGGCG